MGGKNFGGGVKNFGPLKRLCKCPKHNCEEVPENTFKSKKSIFVMNPGAHFTLKISVNKKLEPTLPYLGS